MLDGLSEEKVWALIDIKLDALAAHVVAQIGAQLMATTEELMADVAALLAAQATMNERLTTLGTAILAEIDQLAQGTVPQAALDPIRQQVQEMVTQTQAQADQLQQHIVQIEGMVPDVPPPPTP